MSNRKKILIVRTDRIGDVILTLPMASVLKKMYPESQITFLVREYTKALVSNSKYVDEVIVLNEKNGRILFYKNLAFIKNQFDICFIVSPIFILSLIIFFSKIQIRIGTGYRWYSFLFNRKVFEHRKYGTKHELEHNLDLISALNNSTPVQTDDIRFDLQASSASYKKIEKYFTSLDIKPNQKIIIVHPGSGGSAVDLPISKMRMLVKSISSINSVLFITGSGAEKELCESLVVSPNVINTAGNFNLDDLIAFFDKADLVIANSTGPIHIAAALSKWVIGFYPKIHACSPVRWGPYTNKKIIFQPEICDGNCTTERCAQLDCMNSINIDHVTESVNKILNNMDMEN